MFEKEIDMFVSLTGVEYALQPEVDFSYPVRFDDVAIVKPYPTIGESSTALYLAFTWPVNAKLKTNFDWVTSLPFQVWICVMVSSLLIIVVGWLLGSQNCTLATWSLSVVACASGQGKY